MITAIITAFNRPERLLRCYLSLRQHHPAMPTIIVDTGTRPARLPADPSLSYLHRPELDGNVSAARNAGIREAQTEYAVLLDDDYEFTHASGLPALLDVVQSDAADAAAGVLCNEVAGEWRPIYCAHDLATVGTDLMQYAPGQPEQVTPSGTRYQPCQLTWCYLLAKRETFIRLPWHDALPCGIECFDWFLSAARAGLRLAMVPDATVRHHPGGDEAYSERRSSYQSHLQLLGRRWGVDRIKQTSATKPAGAMIRNPKSLPKPKPRRTGPVRAGLLIPGLGLGGAEICAAMLVQHCDPERIRWQGVVNANGNPPRPEITKGIEPTCQVLTAADARDMARQCDVLITWGLPNLGELLGGKPPCRTVLVSHGSCGWTRSMLQRAKPFASHLAAVSLAAARAMGSSRWVEVVHNGVDLERLEPTESTDATRTSWRVQPDERLVGYLGRLSAEKRPLSCVRAAMALGEPWRPVLIGGGPHADRWRDEALRMHPRAICIDPTPNVGDVLRALDCFVLASPNEGMSLALLEAWACGVPTVCTPVGAVPELEDLHGPLTVPVPREASPEQLAEAVHTAYGRQLVGHAQATVLRRYTAKAMAQRWTNYLEGICR